MNPPQTSLKPTSTLLIGNGPGFYSGQQTHVRVSL